MPVMVKKVKTGLYHLIEVATGKKVAESHSGRNARIAAAIRNRQWLESHLATFQGRKGVWITLKSGKKVFIPLEKVKQYFRKKGWVL
ncbi:hypothetical protein DRO59_07255 [Candidatus Bathyarchaeota archaeon]|nr:MAG: hypothetical protein DRO59_07255 [Candidatus Bathyarchaeota archaeon]